jgi:RNA polymerase sigma-70 factor, ECF subfamily
MDDDRQARQSDDQLMASVAAGNRSAFRCLVERHQKTLWAVALRYAGNQHDAADLVQDAFLALFQKAGRYKPQGRFLSYLLCILVTRAISTRRKQRPTPLESPEPLAIQPDGEGSLALAQSRQTIAAKLAQLPARQRMAIVLRYYEDLSYAEIAETLAISPKAVERLLHRARRTLRGIMDRQQ